MSQLGLPALSSPFKSNNSQKPFVCEEKPRCHTHAKDMDVCTRTTNDLQPQHVRASCRRRSMRTGDGRSMGKTRSMSCTKTHSAFPPFPLPGYLPMAEDTFSDSALDPSGLQDAILPRASSRRSRSARNRYDLSLGGDLPRRDGSEAPQPGSRRRGKRCMACGAAVFGGGWWRCIDRSRQRSRGGSGGGSRGRENAAWGWGDGGLGATVGV